MAKDYEKRPTIDLAQVPHNAQAAKFRFCEGKIMQSGHHAIETASRDEITALQTGRIKWDT
jgi:hypothetical protein